MIVLGIDPGGRSTGFAVVDTDGGSLPTLLASFTATRPNDGEPLTYVPPVYCHEVNAAAADAIRRYDVKAIGVERVEKPKGFANGRKHTIDPAGLIAAGIVYGAVIGRAWTVPLVAIRAGGNGSWLPLSQYPGQLATAGKGHDKRRHERSAYDVAALVPRSLRFAVNGYAP